MTDDTVVALRQPGEMDDPLTEILRAGARQLLAQAVEAEVAAMLGKHGAAFGQTLIDNRLGHHATIFELNVDSIGVLTSGWHFATLPLLIGGTHGSVIQAQRQ